METLAVGTELLLGQIVNSNAAEIGSRLADAGIDHYHQTVVGDNIARITEAITRATTRADALIITGGIGPTQDDVTREAMSAAAEMPMEFSDDYADHLRRWWEDRGRVMPESNLRQAWYPVGAEMIPNPKGTAPGLRMRIGRCWVFAIPGVPAEMLPMVDGDIIPSLLAEHDDRGVVVSRVLRTWGESESRIDELLSDLFTGSVNPTVAFLASAAEIKVRLTARATDREAAMTLIAPVEAEVRRRLGVRVFGADEGTVERILLEMLEERGWSMGTAESATGGMIAAAVTGVPGASASFVGSVVAYDRAVKEGALGVPAGLIDAYGVVSEEVALAMCEGAALALGAHVVVATTGAAGPEPHGAPVGTMVIAVVTPEGAMAKTLRMPGDRERVRTYTVTSALHHMRLAVSGEWWS
ncbi:MAG: competence/damage-inducible protein A [Acidimicrobiia bacterium]